MRGLRALPAGPQGHHMAYLKTINTALAALRANAETKHLAKMGLDKLLQNIDQVPTDLQGPVRNGGENARRPPELLPVSSGPLRPSVGSPPRHMCSRPVGCSRPAAAHVQAGAL